MARETYELVLAILSARTEFNPSASIGQASSALSSERSEIMEKLLPEIEVCRRNTPQHLWSEFAHHVITHREFTASPRSL